MGWEYDYRQAVFLRMGKVLQHHTEDLTFGGGVKLQVGGYILELDIAYAEMGDLGSVERFSVNLSL
jgi:hypothetical protein